MTAASVQDISQRVADHLADNPRAMTLEMARRLDLPECEVVRHLPEDRATELNVAKFEGIMRACEGLSNVHVIVSNTGATMESTGTLGGYSTSAGYFNIQSEDIDMHIRPEEVTAAFAVMKPSHMTGAPTLSLQFFDRRGDSTFKLFLTFGQSEPPAGVRERWNAVRDEFAL